MRRPSAPAPSRIANLSRAIERLQDAGFTVIGLDEDAPRSIYEGACPTGRVALVLGSEGFGISRLVRDTAISSFHADAWEGGSLRGRRLAAVLYGYVLPTAR